LSSRPQRIVWDLCAKTQANAAELYRQGVAELFQITLDEPDSAFRNRLEVYHLGELALCRCSGVPQRFTRTQIQAQRGIDHIQAILLLEGGPWEGLYDGRPADSGMGDLRVMDMARPFDVHTLAYETINLMIPRAMLGEAADRDLHGLVYSSRTPAVRLLTSHLRELWDCLPDMTLDEGMAAARAVALLFTAVVRTANSTPRAARKPLERSLFGAARDFIDQNLSDPDLSPAKIQAHIGVSRAMVYRLFEPVGGVSAYVRRRRLDYAVIAVAATARTGRSLSQVAYDHGFRSDSNFSRAFRARFGIPPGELKSDEAKTLLQPPAPDDIQNALGWFWELKPGTHRA